MNQVIEPVVGLARERRPFWQLWRAIDGPNGPGRAALAALRQGVGREPGSVASLWPYYTTLRADGRPSAALNAEHLALALFAVHQVADPRPMHQPGVGLGDAALALRDADRSSAEALDRRFHAIAVATTLDELGVHLHGLVNRLGAAGQGLDYDLLLDALCDWQDPAGQARVRRRWGAQYYAYRMRVPDRGLDHRPDRRRGDRRPG